MFIFNHFEVKLNDDSENLNGKSISTFPLEGDELK